MDDFTSVFSRLKTSFQAKNGLLLLLGLFTVVIAAYAAPRLSADLFAYVYPPDRAVLVGRSIEPDRFFAVRSGDAITITVVITNNEAVPLRGLYYSDQVPNGWAVNTAGVAVNGSPIEDYVYGQGYAGQIYTGFTPHRWALELPWGSDVFSPTHPISASGGTALLTYTMVVSGSIGGDYVIGYEAWAGWLETVSDGTAVFGHLGITQTMNADFTAEPSFGSLPLTVQFTDLSTGGPTAWAWDFGDGSAVGSQQHPTHTYPLTGTYTVVLTVTRDQPAHSDTVVKYGCIIVTLPPLEADFSALPRFGLPPLTVEFTDLSVGDILTRTWDFGRGSTALLPTLTHTYPALGYYTVSLTVQDAYRSMSLIRPRYIHVTEKVHRVWLPLVLIDYAH
jgi:uncharacterized repeat protein (TIGR01451 family)